MLYGKRYYVISLGPLADGGASPPPYYRWALTNVRGTWDAVVIRLGGFTLSTGTLVEIWLFTVPQRRQFAIWYSQFETLTTVGAR